jgi:transposase
LTPLCWGIAVSDEVVEGTSGHTTGRMSGRIEVVARVSGRRHWTVEQKLSILRDAFGPNGSVRDTVERHEVGSGQLYTWRQQAMSGTLAGVTRSVVPAFAQVQIATAETIVPLLPAPSSPEPTGKIGIELPSGIRLSVDAGVDAEALARVLSVVSR